MKIGRFTFNITCICSPEQYDVFDESGNIAAYIRLRWGILTCECPDIGGALVYSADIGDGWTGCFTSEEERMEHLHNIAKMIEEYYANRKRCDRCGTAYTDDDKWFTVNGQPVYGVRLMSDFDTAISSYNLCDDCARDLIHFMCIDK